MVSSHQRTLDALEKAQRRTTQNAESEARDFLEAVAAQKFEIARQGEQIERLVEESGVWRRRAMEAEERLGGMLKKVCVRAHTHVHICVHT